MQYSDTLKWETSDEVQLWGPVWNWPFQFLQRITFSFTSIFVYEIWANNSQKTTLWKRAAQLSDYSLKNGEFVIILESIQILRDSKG